MKNENEYEEILERKKQNQRKILLITMSILACILVVSAAAVTVLLGRDKPNNSSVPSESISSESSGTSTSKETSDVSSEPAESTDSTDTSSEPVEGELVHKWVINNLGYTYIYGNMGFEQFNAGSAAVTRYADSLNALVKSLPTSVKVYNLLAPTSVGFVDIPREIRTQDNFHNSPQESTLKTIAGKLDEKIQSINVLDSLNKHKDEYLFFRTDINWTARAAYYAYADFATAAGHEPTQLGDHQLNTRDNFLGRFYTATNEPSLARTPDSIEYFLSDSINKSKLTIRNRGVSYTAYTVSGNQVSSSSNGYNTFLGMEAEEYRITTGNAGKKLLLIADTSGAAFVPFLTSHYSEIYYVNPQYYSKDLKDVYKDYKFDEVLVLNYLTTATRPWFTDSVSVMAGIEKDVSQ